MKPLNVTFELVTPAFAGAARPDATDERQTDGLRVPSLKGLLRFWWRTMYPEVKYKPLLDSESALFGSDGSEVGQRFIMRPVGWTQPVGFERRTSPRIRVNDPTPLRYLAYGPITGRDLNTPRLPAGTNKLTTLIRWKTIERSDEVLKALWLLAAFGGYGQRSRRGWGSIRLDGDILDAWKRRFAERLPDPHGARDRDELRARLQAGLETVQPIRSTLALPDHTSFGSDAKLFLGPPKNDHAAALYVAGDLLQRFHQQLGSGGRGQDNSLRRRWLSTAPQVTDRAPLGSAFGLPHNARFPGDRDVHVGVATHPSRIAPDKWSEVELKGRRASPLFVKVLRCGQGRPRFVPLLLWLPAVFLPADRLTTWIDAHGQPKSPVAPPTDAAVNQFLFDETPSDPRLTSVEWTPVAKQNWNWTEVKW